MRIFMRYVVIPYTKMLCEIVKPPSKGWVQGPNRATAISQFNRATAARVGVRSKQPGVSSAAGRTWAVPRSPQGVGGEDGIGDHVGGDLERFIMNGFARRRGAGGNLGEMALIDAGPRRRELYFENPEFGFYFLRLVGERLLHDLRHLEDKLAQERQLRLQGAS